MPIRDELQAIQGQLNDLKEETRANAKEIATAIRKTRLNLAVVEERAALQRLRPPTHLLDWSPRLGEATEPRVAEGLVERLRRGSSVADSLGNVNNYIGLSNRLYDPLFEDIPLDDLTIAAGPGWTPVGARWQARYTLNSGSAPSSLVIRRLERSSSADVVTSSVVEVFAQWVGASTGNISVELEAIDDASGFTFMPYSVIALRVLEPTGGGFTFGTITAAIRLDAMDAPGGTVIASSDNLDPTIITQGESLQRFVAFLGGSSIGTLRVRITLDKPGGSSANGTIRFGDPALANSFSADPTPFAPDIGRWIPGEAVRVNNSIAPVGLNDYALRLRRLDDTGDFWRVEIGLDSVGAPFLEFGPGGDPSTIPDIYLTRAAAGRLLWDTNNLAADAYLDMRAGAARRALIGLGHAADGSNKRLFLSGDTTLTGVEMGDGATIDTRIRRSGSGTIELDDAAGAPLDVHLKGDIVPALAASFAITYGGPSGQPSQVVRSGAAGSATTNISYDGTGKVTSVVVARGGKTVTVTPTYTGDQITSLARAVV